MARSFSWSSYPGSKARLRKLWAAQPELKAEEIALVLSQEFDAEVTADSVLGKVKLLRLQAREASVPPRKIHTPSLAPVIIRKDHPEVRARPYPSMVAPAKRMFAPQISRDAFDPTAHCGWELSSTHVCGLERKKGSLFCITHAAEGSKKVDAKREGLSPEHWSNQFVGRTR